MLSRLRHRTIVSRNHEQGCVDASSPSQHVADEPFVTGNIDDMNPVSGRRDQLGEPEIDRHLPKLLFRQPVRIGTRQRAHQRRLAMIDMPGGTNDKRARHGSSAKEMAERRAITTSHKL